MNRNRILRFSLSQQVLEVEETTKATFNISVDANPKATITWHLNNTQIVADDRVTQSDDGSLIITNTTFDDSGIYNAVADNGLGEAASVGIQLIVHPSRMAIEVYALLVVGRLGNSSLNQSNKLSEQNRSIVQKSVYQVNN